VKENYKTDSWFLGNILAIMHGDGGHYQADHGTEKAVEDALKKWYDRADRIEKLEFRLELEREYRKNPPKPTIGLQVKRFLGFLFRWGSIFVIFWIFLYLVITLLYLAG